MQLDEIFKMAVSIFRKMCFSLLKLEKKKLVFEQMVIKSNIFKIFTKIKQGNINEPTDTSGVPNSNFLA